MKLATLIEFIRAWWFASRRLKLYHRIAEVEGNLKRARISAHVELRRIYMSLEYLDKREQGERFQIIDISEPAVKLQVMPVIRTV